MTSDRKRLDSDDANACSTWLREHGFALCVAHHGTKAPDTAWSSWRDPDGREGRIHFSGGQYHASFDFVPKG